MDNNKFDGEIHKRENSSEWDFEIASKVLKRVKNKRVRYSISISLSSLGAAAIIMFAFLFNISEHTSAGYEQLIQTQLEGTYKDVFNEQYSNVYSVNNDELEYDNIDLLIDNALSIR